MNVKRRLGLFAILANFVLFAAVGATRGDDPSPAIAEVQGKWTRRQATPEEMVTISKEHQGTTTTISATNAAGKVLYAHSSEFTIEEQGKIRIFTYFNRSITAGPNAGQVSKEPISYIYRVHDDRFLEAYGLLKDDPHPPSLVVWERVKQTAKE